MLQNGRNVLHINRTAGGKSRNILIFCVFLVFMIRFLMVILCADLLNGINKPHLSSTDGTETICLRGTTQQMIYLDHNMNGIALWTSHNLLAEMGSITLTLLDPKTGEVVFLRTMRGWQLVQGGYSYFALPETIAISQKSAYILQIQDSHVLGMKFYVGVGESGEGDSFTFNGETHRGSLLWGTVTEYNGSSRKVILLIGAWVVLLFWGGFLFWKSKVPLYSSQRFFVSYYCVLSMICLIALAYASEAQYQYYQFGNTEVKELELLDSMSMDCFFTVPDDHARGITLTGISSSKQTFTTQEVVVQIFDPSTDKILQEEVYPIKNLMNWENLDVIFDDTYNTGTRLGLHLFTRGLVNSGIILPISAESSQDDSLYLTGKATNYHIIGQIYSAKTVQMIPKQMIVFAIAGVILGILLIPLHERYGISLRIKRARRVSAMQTCRSSISHRKIVILIGVIIVIGFFFADYIYTYGIQNLVGKNAVSEAVPENAEIQWMILPSDAEQGTVQTFVAMDDNLSGIGICIKGAEEDYDESRNEEIVVELYDEYHHLLQKFSTPVSTLQTAAQVIWNDTDVNVLPDVVENNSYILFPQQVSDSQGKTFAIRIYSDDGKEVFVSTFGDNPDDAEVSLLLLYNKFTALFPFFMAVFITAMVLFIILLIVIHTRQMEYWQFYIMAALTIGMIYSLMIPPYCIPDETTHIDTIYALSDKIIGLPDCLESGYIYQRVQDMDLSITQTMPLTVKRYLDLFEGLFRRDGGNCYHAVRTANALANVTFFNYAPAVLGFTIGRMAGLSKMTVIMIARWLNMVIVVLLMSFGIRKMPFKKSVMAAVGLLPVMLQQIASCSYDGMTMAFAYLFIGYGFYLIYSHERSIADLIITALSGGLLALSKGGVYLPILGILFMMPQLRSHRKLRRGAEIGGGMAAIAVAARFIPMLLDLSNSSRGEQSGLRYYSLADFWGRPARLLHIFENTIVSDGDNLLLQIGGDRLGNMNLHLPGYLAAAFLFLLLCCSIRAEKEGRCFRCGQKIYILLLSVTGIALIFLSMLVSYTAITETFIRGLQGRYFFPYVILTMLLVGDSNLIYTNKRRIMLLWMMSYMHLFVFGHVFLSVLG